jgi:hypothetical protein
MRCALAKSPACVRVAEERRPSTAKRGPWSGGARARAGVVRSGPRPRRLQWQPTRDTKARVRSRPRRAG